MYPLDSISDGPIPIPPVQIIASDSPVEIDLRSELRNISRQRHEPPLPQQRDLETRRNQREKHPDGTTDGQNVDEEKVILFFFFLGGDEKRRGDFLALAELFDGVVLNIPRIPVVEEGGSAPAEDGFRAVIAGGFEEVVEALIGAYTVQNFPEGVGAVGWLSLGVGWVV